MPLWLTPTLVALALVLFTCYLAWAILRNMREGQRFRVRLARRLEQLRLSRLMRLMGLDTVRYLHEQPIVAVGEHMRTCTRCPETTRCDQALEQRKPEAVATYCANYRSLQLIRGRSGQDT